jgi:hypothetical protein
MDIANEIDKKTIEDIRAGWNRIKLLKEERKSMSEDISEEKKELSKKTGIKVRDLNRIFKYTEQKEKGDWSEYDVDIAERVAGNITHTPPTRLNE